MLRRYRRKSQEAPLNSGELGRAKVELVSGTAFLDWLTGRGQHLEGCNQSDIDAWLAGPRADRHIARQFARWAIAQKLMPRLEFPAGHRGGPTPPITRHDPAMLVRRVLDDPQIPARERVAGILVAVYAQPIVRVARFTIDQITINETETTFRFAQTPVTLPGPISDALRAWLDQRQSMMPPLGAPSPWLFPGNPPSRPIGEQSLSRRLKQIGVDCRQNRRSALMRLAGEIPAAILSEIVGVHVNTAANWADIAGRSWGDYPNLRGLAGPAG